MKVFDSSWLVEKPRTDRDICILSNRLSRSGIVSASHEATKGNRDV